MVTLLFSLLLFFIFIFIFSNCASPRLLSACDASPCYRSLALAFSLSFSLLLLTFYDCSASPGSSAFLQSRTHTRRFPLKVVPTLHSPTAFHSPISKNFGCWNHRSPRVLGLPSSNRISRRPTFNHTSLPPRFPPPPPSFPFLI